MGTASEIGAVLTGIMRRASDAHADGTAGGADGGRAPNAESADEARVESEALMIESGSAAAGSLRRLVAQYADPNELAVILYILYGATLRGLCRLIASAVGVRHG